MFNLHYTYTLTLYIKSSVSLTFGLV